MAATCRIEPLSGLIGQEVSAGQIEAARKAAGARTVRIVRPGQIVTMEYRADRLTLDVDGAGRLVRAACG